MKISIMKSTPVTRLKVFLTHRTGGVRNTETMGVFLLSPGLLPEITRAVKMYPRLQGIRWFVRDAMFHEEALRDDAAATRHEAFCFKSS